MSARVRSHDCRSRRICTPRTRTERQRRQADEGTHFPSAVHAIRFGPLLAVDQPYPASMPSRARNPTRRLRRAICITRVEAPHGDTRFR